MDAILDLSKQLKQISPGAYQITYPGVFPRNHFYRKGLRVKNDFTYDLTQYYGIRFNLDTDEPLKLNITLDIVKDCSPKNQKHVLVTQKVILSRKGKQIFLVPIDSFPLPASEEYDLQFVQGIYVEGNGSFKMEGIQITKGKSIAACCTVSSKAGEAGEKIEYEVTNY